jgi:hypothetical protein
MDTKQNQQPPLAQVSCSATALEAKCAVLEKLVIELTLIAIRNGQLHPYYKSRLDYLLGELQYAGVESPNNGAMPRRQTEK